MNFPYRNLSETAEEADKVLWEASKEWNRKADEAWKAGDIRLHHTYCIAANRIPVLFHREKDLFDLRKKIAALKSKLDNALSKITDSEKK